MGSRVSFFVAYPGHLQLDILSSTIAVGIFGMRNTGEVLIQPLAFAAADQRRATLLGKLGAQRGVRIEWKSSAEMI